MQRIEQLGSATEDVAQTIRWIVGSDEERSSHGFERLPHLVAVVIWLVIGGIAFFYSDGLSTNASFHPVRARAKSQNGAPPRFLRADQPKATALRSYYVAEKPSSTAHSKQEADQPIAPTPRPLPDVADDMTPYRNGETARHLTGEALERALVADRAITTQANIDAQPPGASKNVDRTNTERGGAGLSHDRP